VRTPRKRGFKGTPEPLTCEICQKQFEPMSYWQQFYEYYYCSPWCNNVGKRRNLQRTLAQREV
jgi:hypothetical protein